MFIMLKDSPKKLIRFHTGNKVIEWYESDGEFSTDEINKDHKKFLGWSTTGTKAEIISNQCSIDYSTIELLFNEENSLDLYAVYGDVLTVNFILEDKVTIELVSQIENTERVPNAFKNGFTFHGWSTISESNEIVLNKEVGAIEYSKISPLANGEYSIDFYPIYTKNNIDLYVYNKAEQMAEIHIETDNHLPIDDSSLINPNEHKGKNGELPAYDYVGATISVDHCEDKYVLNEASGKVKVRVRQNKRRDLRRKLYRHRERQNRNDP